VNQPLTSLPATAGHQEEFDAQVNANAGDRGFCLLIVAQLENELDRALDYELKPTSNERTALFLEGGPLGNFSRKITMASALDIVGPISLKNLTNIGTVTYLTGFLIIEDILAFFSAKK
jgi:hypothetical protein